MASRPVVASFTCANMVTSKPKAFRSSNATRALMTPSCSSCWMRRQHVVVDNFSYVQVSPAGAISRPDINARARDIAFLSTELVRVLDEGGGSVGPWHPHLDPADLQIGLRHMLLTRIFDDRMQLTQRAGNISF